MPYLTTHFGNPSSIYSYGRETRLAIENARKTVARLLGAQPAEIFFSSGGTESSNTAIRAAVRDLGCRHIISSPIEHHATLHTIEFLRDQGEVSLAFVRLTERGHVDLGHLRELLQSAPAKTLVTLMHANNEIGNLTNLMETGRICEEAGAIFHSDTVQTIGHFPLDLRNTPVHFVSGSGHKFHGPKGSGILYINQKLQIKPLILGGGQERNMRAGTENIYGIVGFARALELACSRMEEDHGFIAGLKDYMRESLLAKIPGVSFNGDPEGHSLYTVLSVSFPASPRSEMLLMNLDIHGICASGGSACSSGADQGSHVIRALHPDSDRVTVRFSFCRHNTRDEIDQVVEMLTGLV